MRGEGLTPNPITMPTTRQSGFSLLEVLVAFAILSMSLGILYQAFSNSLRNVGASGDYSRAIIIAEARLAEAMADVPLNEGSDQGEVDGRYQWKVMVQRYEYEGEEIVSRFTPYQVEVVVSWQDGKHTREYQLSTLRLSQG